MLSTGAQAAEIERWTCQDKYQNTTWTFTENRMFAAKGKGALRTFINSETLAVAYPELANVQKDKPVVSVVYILDKAAGKLLIYNNRNAAIFKGEFGQSLEPEFEVNVCTQAPR